MCIRATGSTLLALDKAPPYRLAGSTLPVCVAPRALDDGLDTLFLLSQPLVDAALRPPTVLRDSAVVGVFSAILARRGVRYPHLYGEATDSAGIQCFSVDFDTAPLWPSFCALRELDPASSGTPPKMRIEAFVSRRARHECWSLLPTLIECPFAFELDAPWMLDVNRQGLRNDQGRGREWNDAIWQHVPSLLVQLCAWLPASAAPRALIDVDLVHAQRVWPAALEKAAVVTRSVRFLPVVLDAAFEWRSSDELVGARLYRWPKSLAWLAADASTSIPRRHLLLPPMLADGRLARVARLCAAADRRRTAEGVARRLASISIHRR